MTLLKLLATATTFTCIYCFCFRILHCCWNLWHWYECISMSVWPRMGQGHPLSPLSLHFLVFCSFLLFPFLGGF